MSSGHGPSLSRFEWSDPLLLESQLSEDEVMLRDAARTFAQGELQPGVIAAYRDEHTDPALFRKMGEAGLLEEALSWHERLRLTGGMALS